MNDEAFLALRGFEESLEKAPAATLEAAKIAINEGAEYAEAEGRRRVYQNLNLEKAYIHRHLFLKSKATTGTVQARIRANSRAVLAPRYGARQQTAIAKSPQGSLKGDKSRGIPAGLKGAGSTPWSVLRGSSGKPWRNAFFVRLKGSNALGMVARYGSGRGYSDSDDWEQNLDVVTGYSVGQYWRKHRDSIGEDAMELANERFTEELEKRIQ